MEMFPVGKWQYALLILAIGGKDNRSLCSRSMWSTEQVSEKQRIDRETLSQKQNRIIFPLVTNCKLKFFSNNISTNENK